MLQLTDTVTSLAHDVSDTVATLAHEVAEKAQDAAQAASDLGKVATKQGKKAVAAGRHGLESVGVVPKQSHKGRNVLLLVLLAVLGFAAWKVASGRKTAASNASSPEAERLADKNHAKIS